MPELDKVSQLRKVIAPMIGKTVLVTVRTVLVRERYSCTFAGFRYEAPSAEITLIARTRMTLDPNCAIGIEYNSLRFAFKNPAKVTLRLERGKAITFKLPFTV